MSFIYQKKMGKLLGWFWDSDYDPKSGKTDLNLNDWKKACQTLKNQTGRGGCVV